MKTVFIVGSPKKKLAASSFLAGLTSILSGKHITRALRTRADGKAILPDIENGDNVVFSVPLYVDGVPSHVLYFLKEMENYCKENSISVNVYVICNNGFIEGKQSKPQFRVFENFCSRSGNSWMGGLGIGGGVMMNVMRIMLMVYAGILVLNIVSSVIRTGNFLPVDALLVFGKQLAVTAILFISIIIDIVWLGTSLRRQKKYGEKFTRILLPSFVFIIFADIFFAIFSLLQGGIFRGWFSKKPIVTQKSELTADQN